jgi:hypothetical protein
VCCSARRMGTGGNSGVLPGERRNWYTGASRVPGHEREKKEQRS